MTNTNFFGTILCTFCKFEILIFKGVFNLRSMPLARLDRKTQKESKLWDKLDDKLINLATLITKPFFTKNLLFKESSEWLIFFCVIPCLGAIFVKKDIDNNFLALVNLSIFLIVIAIIESVFYELSPGSENKRASYSNKRIQSVIHLTTLILLVIILFLAIFSILNKGKYLEYLLLLLSFNLLYFIKFYIRRRKLTLRVEST